ncbi:MAG: XRE family transcriptional regulator [Verrucomicrobia bacterium]|nr:MAG: XRE family transcriptional regulator [Verrucomicrobiota bacterium]
MTNYLVLCIQFATLGALMKINSNSTDDVLLKEIGARLASLRIEQNLTQAALAEQAGISKRTVERLESGAVATQLSGFLRICRVLKIIDRIDALLPEVSLSPMAQLREEGRKRQRATGQKTLSAPQKWTWNKNS